ncbi:MAG: alpha/beta fold hydrolase [Pirellulales bacterium]|nr:alpha/beta fold hydrolase [Pirellulales bacterium]
MIVGLSWTVLALLGLVALGHVVAWLVYVPIVARVFGQTPWLPAAPREPLDEGPEVEILTEDGVRLEGTYLATLAPRRKGVIAFCHELNADRWAATPYTEDLRQQGFDVFTFDFRNHGTSAHTPGYDPLPWVTEYDLADVRAVINYLCARDDADPRGIGLVGVSKGGTVALCAAADDPRVRTLVIDGACPTERMQLHYIRRFLKIFVRFPQLLAWLPDVSLRTTAGWARWVLGRRRGCRFVTVDQAARRIHQPTLMIHGRRDAHIPLAVVRALRDSMPSRPKLWVTPSAKHNESITLERVEYHRRIARFFNRNLASVVDAAHASAVGPKRRRRRAARARVAMRAR